MAGVEEQISAQFAAFERRGRGWQVFPEPVFPEPPFQKFSGYRLAPVVDDGRRPTIGSSLLSFVARLIEGKPPEEKPPEEPEEPEPVPLVRGELVELNATLPPGLKIPHEAFEVFLSQLHGCVEPVAFEIVGSANQISSQFVVSPEDAGLVRRQLNAFFPEMVLTPAGRSLHPLIEEDGDCGVVEFGLGREFFYPLASGKIDPFVGLVGALSELREKNLGVYQVLFQPCRERWSPAIMRSVTGNTGDPVFVNHPEFVILAKEKVSRPLFAAVVRIAAKSDTFEGAWEILRNLAGALRVFNNTGGNELIPLHNEEYPFEPHLEDVVRRQTRRTGMLLNAEELIGFVHLPSESVRSNRFTRHVANSKAAPSLATNERGIRLGENVHNGECREVILTSEQRAQHTHIIGASGTGKSTLLFNLIEQDLRNGDGFAVVEPHGDLIDRILGVIPENRVNDVILIDPADEEYSVGFNILSAHSDLEKNLLASDLISVFERLSTSWGDQLGTVLRNAILAFLESREGGTLSDLRRFLIDADYRSQFLETVTDPDIVYFWRKAFGQLAGNKSIGPVLTRLDTFLSPKPIRYMVSQKENRVDFADLMDSGKILLARLSSGAIGKENSYLLGSLLMAKFQQTAMSRQSVAAEKRRNFWLYVDEFQNFMTPSMAEILAEARKYKIGLILAHQELRQLERDRDVASAVTSHSYTRIVFRVSDHDARTLESSFSAFEARDFQNLGRGEAVCRVERSSFDFNLRVEPPPAIDVALAAERRNKVIAISRQKYSVPRSEIEARIQARYAEPKAKSAPKSPPDTSGEQPAQVAQALRQAAARQSPTPEKPPETSPPTNQPPSDPQPEIRELQASIQERIHRAAESLGFEAKRELVVEGGGRIDIALYRGPLSIACEITVTTPVEYEAGSVVKRLRAGFGYVALVSTDKRKLARIKKAVGEVLSGDDLAKVFYFEPNEMVEQLHRWAEDTADAPKPKTPPKQTIAFNKRGMDEFERKRRESDMLKGIAARMKRPKD